MKSIIYACAIIFSYLSSPAQADPKADADYIVSQVVTRAIFEGALIAQKPLIIGAIQNSLRAKKITLPKPDRFFTLFMEEFLGEFTRSMQDQSASIYLENFSEQQLADLAKFFKTESGQAYISAVPTLMARGAEMGRRAGLLAGTNAGKRLAARIKSEGLLVVNDPSLLQRLLDALR